MMSAMAAEMHDISAESTYAFWYFGPRLRALKTELWAWCDRNACLFDFIDDGDTGLACTFRLSGSDDVIERVKTIVRSWTETAPA